MENTRIRVRLTDHWYDQNIQCQLATIERRQNWDWRRLTSNSSPSQWRHQAVQPEAWHSTPILDIQPILEHGHLAGLRLTYGQEYFAETDPQAGPKRRSSPYTVERNNLAPEPYMLGENGPDPPSYGLGGNNTETPAPSEAGASKAQARASAGAGPNHRNGKDDQIIPDRKLIKTGYFPEGKHPEHRRKPGFQLLSTL